MTWKKAEGYRNFVILTLAQTTVPPTDQENPSAFPYMPALDGIRGLAILFVLACHLLASNDNTGSRVLDFFQQVRGSLYCGVNLFFALSGFLITGILVDTLGRPNYFKTFYARRTVRIFPLYYGSLGILLFLTHPLHFHWNGWQYYFLTYTENLPLWRTAVPLEIGNFNINHFWSLQVEEQFYFVWPFIVYRVKRPATLARIALIACVPILALRIFFVVMRDHPHFTWVYLPYSPTFCCADNLLIGCALSALLRTSARERVLRFAPRVFALCLASLAVVFVLNHGLEWRSSTFMPTLGFTLLGVTSTSLIATTLRAGSAAQGFFSSPFLRFFGKLSYGLYVFHYSIEGYLTGPLRALVFEQLHSKALAVLLSALVVAGLSVMLAMLSYRFFELPFLRLKRFFNYSRSAKEIRVTAVAESD